MRRVLLHICCAPDGTVPMDEFKLLGTDIIGYFYGGNIHPSDEYHRRKTAVEKLVRHMKTECVFGMYEPRKWFGAASRFADEPEGGKRCAVCFRVQLENAAVAAVNSCCDSICTTLTISPHKNIELINEIGEEVAYVHRLDWISRVWRKNNGFIRSIKMAKELELFRQNYCGCIYSKR